MLCGTALRNKGIQPLLDAVIDYLPSPVDVPPVTGDSRTARPASARRRRRAVLRARVQDHDRPGRQARVLPHLLGLVEAGDTVYNPIKDTKERIGRILQIHANKREDLEEVRAGDIAAAVGLKDATTGDTLCDPKKPILLERMTSPSR